MSVSASTDGPTRGSGSGSGAKHMTLVVGISAAGELSEVFVLVVGAYKWTKWTEAFPLSNVHVGKEVIDLTRYCEPGWFPKDGFTIVNENGSMNNDHVSVFLHHFHRRSRASASGQRYVVLMDVHSSCSVKDITWLDEASDRKQEIVISPENTSHFLQSADQKTNLIIWHWVKKLEEALQQNGIAATSTVQGKLICAVKAHKRLRRSQILSSL